MKTARQNRPQVILIMEGGVIHEILSTQPTDVTLLDYDAVAALQFGAHDEDVVPLERPGYGQRAYHWARAADVLPAEVETIIAAIEKSLRDHSVTERCNDCDAPVTPADPYHATPCGTFCAQCMVSHARDCEVCAAEFNL